MGRTSYQSNRASITMDKELAKSREVFAQIPDHRASNTSHRLEDVFMSGLAMFSLKYRSLLDFDQQTYLERQNLKSVFGIEAVCSDTQLRRILDQQSAEPIRQYFVDRFSELERTGLLREYAYAIGSDKYLISSSDGVQHFSSKRISCPCCLERAHRDGSKTYHHNLLCSALVHPEKREVFLMGCEPILQQDGSEKNDCELNAAKRLFHQMGIDYQAYQQRYNFLIVEDALYANAPHLRLLQQNGYAYIVNVKPDSHKGLFAHVQGRKERNQTHVLNLTHQGVTHRFEWSNNLPLNHSDPDLRVNFLHYEQTDKKGKKTTFTWATSLKLNAKRVWPLMKAARARWKIENETFNTLKNLGYHFEHNYGHGKDHLSNTLAHLMLMAFYIDQFVQACSKTFQVIEEQIRTKIKLWQTIKAIFQTSLCQSMDQIYRRVASLFQIKLE